MLQRLCCLAYDDEDVRYMFHASMLHAAAAAAAASAAT
jgi:hypothetical protein